MTLWEPLVLCVVSQIALMWSPNHRSSWSWVPSRVILDIFDLLRGSKHVILDDFGLKSCHFGLIWRGFGVILDEISSKSSHFDVIRHDLWSQNSDFMSFSCHFHGFGVQIMSIWSGFDPNLCSGAIWELFGTHFRVLDDISSKCHAQNTFWA